MNSNLTDNKGGSLGTSISEQGRYEPVLIFLTSENSTTKSHYIFVGQKTKSVKPKNSFVRKISASA